ncbi:TPA: hypothetical protein QCX22_005608 [Bacillus toyonensis]|nr:hypothetical protein [Bacillus toyonensis]
MAFFRNIFTTKIGGLSKITHSLAAYFERIRILDSTTFQFPNQFAATYPVVRECSHVSGVKIELGKRNDNYNVCKEDVKF